MPQVPTGSSGLQFKICAMLPERPTKPLQPSLEPRRDRPCPRRASIICNGQVLGSLSQREQAEPSVKWQLVDRSFRQIGRP
jgi:hypothetical protein